MIFLPIADRELRVAARRKVTFWIRWGAALACLLLWLVMAMTNQRLSPVRFGQMMFTAFGIIAFGFALLSGIFLTADCLSEEKREGTLGLLFLTDLKGYDVVIGKLTATSMHALYAMLAIFPIMAIPLLMGGVSGGEFWRMMLVLVVTLFLSLSIGMLSSALNREARQAMAASLLALIVLAGVLPALWWLDGSMFKTGSVDILLLPSPAHTFRSAYDFCYGLRNGPREFWSSLFTLVAMGCAFLGVTAFRLPRSWRDEGRQTLKSSKSGTPAPAALVQPGRKVPLRDLLPCFWLARRDQSIPRIGRVLMTVLVTVWGIALFFSFFVTRGAEPFIVSMFSAYAVHQLAKYFMAIEATRQLSADRQSGALELLLVTPIGERAILSGIRRAFSERFRNLWMLLLGINFCLCVVTLLSTNLNMGARDRAIFLELFLGGMLVLIFDIRAIRIIGVCMALRPGKPGRAVLGTLMRVLLPPWFGIFLIIFTMQSRGGSSAGTAALIFACWFFLGVLNDLFFTSIANSELRAGIRKLISEPRPTPSALQVPPFPTALEPVKT